MFRPERNTSPFSLLDMDMWDANLTAQSSAWCGMATVSGSGFLSKVNTSSSGGTGGFRQSDPGLRKWQSLSHLAPNGSPRSFSPLPQSELHSGQGQSALRQAGVMQWLQEAQERMDSHMDLLRTTDSGLNSKTMLDIKTRERQISDAELYKLKQALREAESRAKIQEEECKQTLQKLQTATEGQRALLTQTTELNKRLTQTLQNHSELQEQLSEANNKISKACLEKAMLSTQVLKLEDNVHQLKTKLSAALHDKDHLAQERADLQEKTLILELQLENNIKSQEGCEQHNGLDYTNTDDQETASLKEEVTTLREVNEELTNEIDAIKQALKQSQAQVQELTTENDTKSQQITDLEVEHAELVTKIKTDGQEEMDKSKEQLSQLRESFRSLKFENQRQQDCCVFLENEIFEKEQQLKLLEEKYRRIDAGRVQYTEELKSVVSHWTDKWQKVALILQSTHAELEELRRKYKNESESLLRLELDACKQELELERNRSKTLLNKTKNDGVTVQTQDQETMTDPGLLSPAFYLDSQSNQDKQLVTKTTECDEDVDDLTDAQIIESLKGQLEESKRTAVQLELEKTLALQELQALKQLHPAKDKRPSAEDRSEVDFNTEQQRKLVNEQLKSLFKEQEESDMVTSEDRSVSAQDWTQMSRGIRSALHDKRSWHQGSGLMPVFEEEEPGDEDQDAVEKMSTVRKKISNHKAKNSEPQDPAILRSKQTIKGLEAFAEKVSHSCTSVSDLKKTLPLFCPDGIFHVEMVDICSPDED